MAATTPLLRPEGARRGRARQAALWAAALVAAVAVGAVLQTGTLGARGGTVELLGAYSAPALGLHVTVTANSMRAINH